MVPCGPPIAEGGGGGGGGGGVGPPGTSLMWCSLHEVEVRRVARRGAGCPVRSAVRRRPTPKEAPAWAMSDRASSPPSPRRTAVGEGRDVRRRARPSERNEPASASVKSPSADPFGELVLVLPCPTTSDRAGPGRRAGGRPCRTRRGCASSGVWRFTYQPRGEPSGSESSRIAYGVSGHANDSTPKSPCGRRRQMPRPVGEPELDPGVVERGTAADERRDEQHRLLRQILDDRCRSCLEDRARPRPRGARSGRPVCHMRGPYPGAPPAS